MSERRVLDREGEGPFRVLEPDGSVAEGASVPSIPERTLVGIYRDMRMSRRFDERAISLQRQGRIGTFPSLAGQEAAQVASTHALEADDWVLYQYREHGAVVVRGLEPEYLRYWMGDERGNEWLAERNVFPINITIADQLPHAVGMAFASKYDDGNEAFVCHFGDGATSEGDFHEALNFAGVFDTPTVFFCNNNGWAISTPRERQTASETFAEKAEAYGFEGVRVDGMDPVAVYQVTAEALKKAKEPDDELRPTMIEAVQYRFGAHTTADDPSVYREDEEVREWREKDPIPRMEAFLRERGLLDDERVDAIEGEIEERLADVIEAAESMDVDPDAMFESVYEELPPRVRDQRDRFRAFRERHGDEPFEGE
jgi:pyruvate dehydrogenase E1 component alpha subunit